MYRERLPHVQSLHRCLGFQQINGWFWKSAWWLWDSRSTSGFSLEHIFPAIKKNGCLVANLLMAGIIHNSLKE